LKSRKLQKELVQTQTVGHVRIINSKPKPSNYGESILTGRANALGVMNVYLSEPVR